MLELLPILSDTPPGSVVVPWWLRFGLLVYGALLVAALMIYIQTKHPRPWNVIWPLVVVLVPILGAIAYFIGATITYRRQRDSNQGPGKQPPGR